MDEGIKRGDIYYIVSNYAEQGSEQRAGRPAIIVSNDKNNVHSEVVEVVYLTTRPKTDLPTHIDIRSAERPSIALCEQVNSISKERLGMYIGHCTETEKAMLDAALMISLGINDVKVVEKKAEKTAPPPREDTNDSERTAQLQNELSAVGMERDIYKKLYDGLMDKLVGRLAV